MSVSELLQRNDDAHAYPQCLFHVMDDKGEQKMFCRASFLSETDRNRFMEGFPGIMDWEVTKEFLENSDLPQHR